jgi:Cu-Zn family superoxide dismutase
MAKLKKVGLLLVVFLVPALWLGATATEKQEPKAVTVGVDTKMPVVKKAICVIHGIGANKVHGIVMFEQKGHTITITGEISGLTEGKHGFHVHEFGDCSSKDGMSAGTHFNPDMMPHAGPHDKKRHVGDLGNITADKDGKAVIKITDSVVALNGAHSIIGRSIIVHAKEDDLKDIASAGPRIGCGVIGIAKP